MKKTLALAAFALSAASAASAAQYGDDSQGTLTLSAPVAVFCKFTDARGSGAVNGQPFGLTQADALVQLDIQRVTDSSGNANTIKADTATIRLPDSQCNTRFALTLSSANGGLKNPAASGVADPQFVQVVPYAISVEFGAVNLTQQASSVAGPDNVVASGGPTFDDFEIEVAVSSDTGKRLVSGSYGDAVVFKLMPQ